MKAERCGSMCRHLLLSRCASPKRESVWEGGVFLGKANGICAYHPNCIASLILWEHFFFFFLLWVCARVCCRLVDISVLFSSKRIVASLWDVLRKCGGIYGFLVGCIFITTPV